MMSRKPIHFLAALVFLVLTAATRAEHYEVFLLAGQSNMDGRGEAYRLKGDLEKFARPLPNVAIVYGHAEKTLTPTPQPVQPGFSIAPGNKARELQTEPAKKMFGPEIGFAHAISAAMPDKKILLIKSSKGGTSLQKDWNPETKDSLYQHMIALVVITTYALKSSGDTYTLHGFIWHQGESDAALPPGEYLKLFTAFAGRLRNDLKLPNLPIVVGEVVDNGKRDHVLAALRELPTKLPHTALVSAKDLKTSDKDTHFDAASQLTLGARYAAEMLKLLKK
jgi:iduronate 2-sulfatase